MANKYGETGEAAKLRKQYQGASGDAKAAIKLDLRQARQTAGLRTQAPAKQNPQGFLAEAPIKFNDDKIDSAQGALGTQQQVNQYNAWLNASLNRPTEVTPFGTQEYSIGPDGQVVRKQSLSGNQGQINSLQEQLDIKNLTGADYLRDQASNTLRDQYSLGMLAPMQTDFSKDRQHVEDSLYNRFSQRNEPLFQQQQSAEMQRLQNQGLMPGSSAWNSELNRMTQGQNDLRLGAQANAVGMGLQEQQGQFGMSQQARNQGIQEYEAQRYAPVQEMQMLQGSARGLLSPQFSPMANVDVGNVDVAGTFLGYNPKYPPMQQPTMSGGGGVSQPNYGNALLGLQGSLTSSMGGGQQQGGGGGGQTLVNSFSQGFGGGFGFGAASGANRWAGGRGAWGGGGV